MGRDLSRCAASIARRVYARDSEKLTVFRQQRNTCEYNRMLRRESIYADSNFLPTSPLPPRQNSFPFFEPVGRVPRIRRGCGQNRRKSCKLEKSKEYLRISQKSIDFFSHSTMRLAILSQLKEAIVVYDLCITKKKKKYLIIIIKI